jgi:cytochrome b6-f complex iron-sulfur subunit
MKLLSSLITMLVAGSASAFAPTMQRTSSRSIVSVNAGAASEEFYIDDERRFIMNVLMVGAGLTVVGEFGIPFVLFFFPPGSGGGSAGTTAKDALGNDIVTKEYLASKPAGDRSLAQGLKGDAT